MRFDCRPVPGTPGSTPGTVATGADWFVNWADFPSVTPIGGDALAAHWLVYQRQGFGYDVMLSTSADGGVNWREPFPLHVDGTPTEHGFVTLFPWNAGFAAVWLDGRNMIQDGEFAFENSAGEPLGMGLRHALFSVDGERLATGELDPLACDCCQTDVVLNAGDALLAYRDQDHSGGARYRVAPAFGGWMAAAGGAGARQLDHRGLSHQRPRHRRSRRPRSQWPGSALRTADRAYASCVPATAGARSAMPWKWIPAAVFGHVDVAALANGETAVSWLRTEDDGLALALQLISRDGEQGEPATGRVNRRRAGRSTSRRWSTMAGG